MTGFKKRNIGILFLTAIMTLACVPTFAPAFTPIPTFDPNSIITSIAETINAASTQTQLFITPSLTPTFTSTPTKTPTETTTPTVTFIFILNSPTASSTVTPTGAPRDVPYTCDLVSQTPEDNSLVARGAPFTTTWRIKNAGTSMWNSNTVDYRFKSGDKLHLQAVYDLKQSIIPTGTVDITVSMAAPNAAGTYKTVWTLRAGKQDFCRLDLTIRVN